MSSASSRRNGAAGPASSPRKRQSSVVSCGPNFLGVANGQLEGGALQMAHQNFQVVGVDVRVLGRTVEEVLGMLDDVLIERRAGGHQHRQRRGCRRPARPARCHDGRDGSGIAGHHHGVERSDVDAQLESVGGDHGADLAIAQFALDLPAFARQIAAAISAHHARRAAGRARRRRADTSAESRWPAGCSRKPASAGGAR